MGFKVPKNKKELMSMSEQDQQTTGDFLGRLLAHDKTKFEELVGMPAEQYGEMFNDATAVQPAAAQQPDAPVPLMSQAAARAPKATRPEDGKVEKFKVDVRNGQKVPVGESDNGEPGPFELVFTKKPGGKEEVTSYGTRAKEFLK
jgi:hypothetical protein